MHADWAGHSNKKNPNDRTGVLSCSGYLVKYANFPIIWGSKMQSLVALSTTEAELITLLLTSHEVIHLQHLLQELHMHKIPVPFTNPQVHCLMFEDNGACIEVVSADPKICPHTKHIAVELLHFREHVEKGLISIEHVPSWDQRADIFSKPLPHEQFCQLHDSIMGWASNPVMV